MDPHELGKTGEDLAVNYLENKGYRILDRNWRSGHNEIDIVAMDGEILVAVEVKTRKSATYGEPETAVTVGKQQMLIRAVDAYIRYKNLDVDVRFDIISIILNEEEQQIEHIEDAWMATSSHLR